MGCIHLGVFAFSWLYIAVEREAACGEGRQRLMLFPRSPIRVKECRDRSDKAARASW